MEKSRRVARVVFLSALIAFLVASPAGATSLVRARTETGVDWTSAGIGGVPAGSASITRDRRDGYQLSNPGGELQSLRLKGAVPGRATIVARSAGGAFSLPAMPLAPPVIVRLRARNGLCWGVNFSTPKRNTAKRFVSQGDVFYPGH